MQKTTKHRITQSSLDLLFITVAYDAVWQQHIHVQTLRLVARSKDHGH